jgi:asparagine synthase (glutamine-hydrolysing)
MSAICGLYRRDGAPVDADAVRSMLGKLLHRGPDGHAAWSKHAVGLGHAMLHVTPESLSEPLPLVAGDDAYAITADARIDNRAELIAALETGFPLQDLPDSALILAAYRKWGQDCAIHLIGDFAFAIWDERNKTIFCAVDAVGVRSFYYYLSDRIFAFATEIKALVALPEVPCRLNEMRVAEYLVTLFEDRTGTFYDGILRLPGGCTLTVDRHNARLRQYWALDPQRELRLGSDGEYAEAFGELLTEAVRCRTRSAFPIGAALSGGLDSSAIACIARRQRTEKLHTFSLIFPGLPAEDRKVIDERPQIQAVLDSGGFEPHFIEADRISPMWQADRMHYHLDHANCAPNLYLHWAMYDSARSQGVRVFLDGFDGDATVSHGFERLTELAQTLHWRTLWRETKLLSENHLAGMPPGRILKEFCVKPFAPRWAHLAWHFLKGRRREALARNVLISQELKDRTGIEQRARSMLRSQSKWQFTHRARTEHWRCVTQALYAFTLEMADKASGAFAVEARYPFFDRRLMEFCLALPAEQKLGQGWNRWVFRRAMEGVLPEEIQWRPKKGNLSPNFHRRLLDFERQRLEEVIFGDGRQLRPYVDGPAMVAAYHEYQKNHVRSQGESVQLFAAVNLALWLRSSGFSSS